MNKIANNIHVDGNKVISYETEVAIIDFEAKTVTELGKYSGSTTRHVKKVADLYGFEVIKADKKNRPAFDKLELGVKIEAEDIKEASEEEEDQGAALTGLMGMFSLMAGMGTDNLKDQNEARGRIVFATPGIIKPEDWDELPEEEKKKRLDAVEKEALKK